jgi:hypothetical protein
MTVPKVAQKQIATTIAAMKQAALGGDEPAAVTETQGFYTSPDPGCESIAPR